MNPSTRVQGDNGPVHGSVLEPAAAWGGPRGPLHELGGVVVEVSNGLGLGTNGLDVLRLNLFHKVDEILGVMLDDGQDGAVSNWRIGAKKH